MNERLNERLKIDYLILAGGRLPPASYIYRLQAKAKEIITVDHGAMGALKIPRAPSLHVGDGDSFLAKDLNRLKPKKIVKLSPDKSISDLEYTLNLLPARKIKVVIGAHQDRDDRPDHGLANLLLLREFKNLYLTSETHWFTGVTKELSFATPTQTLFSILAFSSKTKVTLKGAQYPLKKEQLHSPSHGLSNMSQATTQTPWVHIKVTKASILYVQASVLDTKIRA